MAKAPHHMDILLIEMVSNLRELLAHHRSGHFRRTPGWRTVREDPGDHLLIWVLDAELVGRCGETPIRAGPGDLVVLPPHVPHAYEPEGPGWRWLWVHFGGSAAPELRARLSPAGTPRVRLGFDGRVQARFLELVAAAGRPWRADPRDDLRVDSCLFSLLGLIVDRVERTAASGDAAGARTGAAAGSATGGELAAVLAAIEEHLDEPLTLDRLAALAGFSPSHLRRLFHRELGTSPMRYVTELRVSRAATLLQTSTLSVAAVGRAVGYADPFHFSRRFRQLTGRSPARYRTRR